MFANKVGECWPRLAMEQEYETYRELEIEDTTPSPMWFHTGKAFQYFLGGTMKGFCFAGQTAAARSRPRPQAQACGTCWCGDSRQSCSGWRAPSRFLCWSCRGRSAA